MKILLTNDDGIFAPGLAAVYTRLTSLGQVTVVAPMDSRSGTGHSVTFHKPLTCTRVDINGLFKGYSVEGSPADCVKLAVMQLHEGPIDLVVAGINSGANAGINVYYSGTVAAAMEAAFLRIPSVALSLVRDETMDYDAAADYSIDVLRQLLPLQSGDVMNVNIPSLSVGPPKGVVVVPHSTSGLHEYYIPQNDDANETHYQLAGGAYRNADNPADTTALEQGFATVTPLLADMTDHKRMTQFEARFAAFQWKGADRLR